MATSWPGARSRSTPLRLWVRAPRRRIDCMRRSLWGRGGSKASLSTNGDKRVQAGNHAPIVGRDARSAELPVLALASVWRGFTGEAAAAHDRAMVDQAELKRA